MGLLKYQVKDIKHWIIGNSTLCDMLANIRTFLFILLCIMIIIEFNKIDLSLPIFK